MNHEDANFLEYIVKAIVDNPQDVKVVRVVDEMGVRLDLFLAPSDMGKVIGRSGKTAAAIRTLVRVFGMKNNARVSVKINEPEGSVKQNYSSQSSSDVDDAIEELKGM